MGDIKGFIKYERSLPNTIDPKERIENFDEFYIETEKDHKTTQAARCMDCGVPFCHNGCPLGNVIPDFNDAVHKNDWKSAYEILDSTNNFPEFTGRICPAPCEASCVLGINSDPVAIEYIEKSIIEKAFAEGWVQPIKSDTKSGKKVAIVGSGPAGLACAEQLNKAGHSIVIYERSDRLGGLLRYGIPDFKLAKTVVDRRINLMKESGIEFVINTEVGKDIDVNELNAQYDTVVLCCGSTIPRDIAIQGREVKGVYFAMQYLEQSNKVQAGDVLDNIEKIDVRDKNVVVIGGGDTGSDCIGTSNRLKAKSIIQVEIMGKPDAARTDRDPWPLWPMTLRTSSSHEEGCDREWSILTKAFLSDDGVNLSGIQIVNVRWDQDDTGQYKMIEDPTSERTIPCDYVFIAAGFLHPQQTLIDRFGLETDKRGNVLTKGYQSSKENVFAAGDMRRGQSLVVWAISEGREAAIAVDEYLTGQDSILESKEESLLAV